MKTSEFIKQFNELDTIYDIRATKEVVFSHGVEVNEFENNKYKTVARLPEDENDWIFFGCFNFSPQMLELMAKLAKTPPEEREEQPKYVILNGLPHHGTCYYFFIDRRYGQLISNNVDGAGIEKYASFSEEWLRDCKKMLTPELAVAVDKLTVRLECAIELTEKSKHDDLD